MPPYRTIPSNEEPEKLMRGNVGAQCLRPKCKIYEHFTP